MALKKGGSTWVDGDKFFNREYEMRILVERVQNCTHTLLTAPRRMGKTSILRELHRRISMDEQMDAVFVDLEAAKDPAGAIAELAVQTRQLGNIWHRLSSGFINNLMGVGDRVEELSISEFKLKLRAVIDTGNWMQRGDEIFSALAVNDHPVVLSIDELPILINRLIKDNRGRITPEGRVAAASFLSWLRRNGQEHGNRVTLILAGSIGLEPLLDQAKLSAQINIFEPLSLKPWSEDVAISCLEDLADTYHIKIPPEVCQKMIQNLRCCIPHHVQMYFEKLHSHLLRVERDVAGMEDAESVYYNEMLSVRGQVNLRHYENRLHTSLGNSGYEIALELLTFTADKGRLTLEEVFQYSKHFKERFKGDSIGIPTVDHILHLLVHDGYLTFQEHGYYFESKFLEDWWRYRYTYYFKPVIQTISPTTRKRH